MAHKFVMQQNKAGEYVAKLKYNNEAMLWTESYSSRSGAVNAIGSFRKTVQAPFDTD